MSKVPSVSLSEENLILFGTIMQWFARYEVLMQQIMATVSGADVTSIKLLTIRLSFTEKREALFNLLRHRAVPHDQVDQILSYFQVVHAFTPLRNDIAHSVWIEGKPQNSIWPVWLTHGPLKAIKPLHDVGDRVREFVESDEDKVTYTLDDLREISQNLALSYAGMEQYAIGVGLAPSNVE